MTDHAITFQDVSLRYGRFEALKDLSFNVPSGSIYGLIGNNGAGKTTAMHALLGLLPVRRGKISLLGTDPQKRNVDVLKDIGFFPEKDEPFEWMRLRTLFRMHSHTYPSWDKKICKDLCGIFDLDPAKRVKALSKGMMAKMKLIFALSHHPKCLVLDEPTGGLDPTSRYELISIINRMSTEQNITTMISSHNLDEISDICTDVGIIHHGYMLFSENIARTKKSMALLKTPMDSDLFERKAKGQIICSKQSGQGREFIIRDINDNAVKSYTESDPSRIDVERLTLKEVFVYLTSQESLKENEVA